MGGLAEQIGTHPQVQGCCEEGRGSNSHLRNEHVATGSGQNPDDREN